MHRHPITCIIPPHMLKEIVHNGTQAQREFAMLTMAASEQFRGQRQATRDFASVLSFAIATGKERIIYDAQEGSKLPGVPVRREGDPATADPEIGRAHV